MLRLSTLFMPYPYFKNAHSVKKALVIVHEFRYNGNLKYGSGIISEWNSPFEFTVLDGIMQRLFDQFQDIT